MFFLIGQRIQVHICTTGIGGIASDSPTVVGEPKVGCNS